MNPKTIVCPIELSAADHSTLAQALSLARWHDADLHVVHVAPPPGRRRQDVGRDDSVEARLEHLLGSLRPADVKLVGTMLSGDAVTAIAEYSRDVDADLIVVGRRRARGYRSYNTFAEALSRAVVCPTIAVPVRPAAPQHAQALFRNVLCAVDFSTASLHALDAALVLAQRSAGNLTVLHVLDAFPYESVYSGSHALSLIHEHRARAERINSELHALIPADAFDWCHISVETVSGEAHRRILAAASERNADLIVLGLPQKRGRLAQLLASSTASSVLRRTTTPVLLAPGPRPVAASRSNALNELDRELGQNSSASWTGIAANASSALRQTRMADETMVLIHSGVPRARQSLSVSRQESPT